MIGYSADFIQAYGTQTLFYPPCLAGSPKGGPVSWSPQAIDRGRKDGSMRIQEIDQIVNEILTDMSHREKDATAQKDTSFVPNFEDAL